MILVQVLQCIVYTLSDPLAVKEVVHLCCRQARSRIFLLIFREEVQRGFVVLGFLYPLVPISIKVFDAVAASAFFRRRAFSDMSFFVIQEAAVTCSFGFLS